MAKTPEVSETQSHLLSPALSAAKDLGASDPEEKHFKDWFKHPPFILVEEPKVVGKVTPDLQRQLGKALRDIYGEMEPQIVENDSQVVHWEEVKGKDFTLGSKERLLDHAVIYNPVFLGELNPKALKALNAISEMEKRRDEAGNTHSLLFDENAREPYMYALRDEIAETDFPFLTRVADPIQKQLHLSKEVRNNFVNLVFIDDTTGAIRNLPQHWRQFFNWMIDAKFGAFKSAFVLYEKKGDEISYDTSQVIATLEGGFRTLSGKDMVDQLGVFASGLSTAKTKETTGREFTKQEWENSQGVKNIIRISKFLGKHKLVTPGLKMEYFVEGFAARKMRERAAEFSQQSEGAIRVRDHELGVDVVTATGRFGAINVKSNVGPGDVVAVEPIEGDSTGVAFFNVEGMKMKPPSVEGPEFSIPAKELRESSDPAHMVNARRVAGGYEVVDPSTVPQNELLRIDPISGVLHIHRDIEPASLPDEVIHVEIEDDMIVGCGVDLMEDKSRRVMQKAVAMWHEGGRQAQYAVYRVPGHGINFYAFPTARPHGEIEQFIPEYPFEDFENLVEQNEKPLEILPHVDQTHRPITVFEYVPAIDSSN